MKRILFLSTLLLIGPGCQFNSSGLPAISPGTDAAPADSSANDTKKPAHDVLADSPKPALDGPLADGRQPDGAQPDSAQPDVLKPDLLQPDLFPSPDTLAGHWYQADEALCPGFCENMGLTSAPSPEGAHCMSGEVRPLSGILQGDILFPNGCYPSCNGEPGPFEATTTEHSNKGYCYKPGQKQDWDKTDKTVACFCE